MQVHQPGSVAQSDFIRMTDLVVTLANDPASNVQEGECKIEMSGAISPLVAIAETEEKGFQPHGVSICYEIDEIRAWTGVR